MNDLNEMLAYAAQLKKQGFTPQMAMDILAKQNPELQTAMVQLKNMSQGRPMNEVVSQLCRQNGIDYDSILKMF